MILIRVLFQTVFLAIGQIWSNKIRSMLTTLGIIIGVAAVIAVVGVLSGLEQQILDQFEKFGTKRVFIGGKRPEGIRGHREWRQVQLTIEEVQAIDEHVESLTKVVPMWNGRYRIENGDRAIESVRIAGIWPQWHDIENRQILTGRPFSALDEELRRQVCLINEMAIEELNLNQDPIGDFILLAGRRFQIVGIVETIELTGIFAGDETSTEVFVPFATARFLLNPYGVIIPTWGELKSVDDAETVKQEVAFVLRTMRGIEPGEEDTFQVQVMQNFIDQFNTVANVMKAGAGGIVAISLLVGGIGIMNIMLVSVSERTREIGLRKAMGAKPMIILMQFLVEAIVLCLAGAAVGLAVGQGLVFLARTVSPEQLGGASVPPWAIGLSVGFSAGIGIVFGMFPAIKAARLNPIDALRHE